MTIGAAEVHGGERRCNRYWHPRTF